MFIVQVVRFLEARGRLIGKKLIDAASVATILCFFFVVWILVTMMMHHQEVQTL